MRLLVMKPVIKPLTPSTFDAAIALKVALWQEELNGVFDHQLSHEEEFAFYQRWAFEGIEPRPKVLGAYHGETLVGAIFSSPAETADHPDGVEVNGLWVHPNTRHQGIAKKLLFAALKEESKRAVILYAHTYAPSYPMYLHLGGEVIKTLVQLEGRLHVSVFCFDRLRLLKKVGSFHASI